MNEINDLFGELALDDDNRSKCLEAIENHDLELMYEIAEDLNKNYMLDYKVYPESTHYNVISIRSLVNLILDSKNIEINFRLLYDHIVAMLDVVQNQSI